MPAMKRLAYCLVLFSCVFYVLAARGRKQRLCVRPNAFRPCRGGGARTWGFDFVLRMCKLFVSASCSSTESRFVSEKMCQHACLPPPQRNLICSLAPKPGPCSPLLQDWHFDAQTGFCKRFPSGFCSNNPNSFPSCESCMNRCSDGKTAEVCHRSPSASEKPKV
nr:amblin-like [Dermacentor andersoni]